MNHWMIRMAAIAVCVGAAVTLGLGCGKSTVKGHGGKALTIVTPADQTLSRGETNKVLITVKRTSFEGHVQIKFKDLPSGVSVVNDESGVSRDDYTTTVTLVAAADAAIVENHLVKVTAEGPDGLSVTEFFKVTVKP